MQRRLSQTQVSAGASVPHLADDVIDLLTDERLIKVPLVLPFRFSTALEALEKERPHGVLRVIAALSDAVDLSLTNVPRFSGKTLVAIEGAPDQDRIAVRIRPGESQ